MGAHDRGLAALVTDPSREGSRARLALAAALLFGEYLVISHLVDAMTVVDRGGVWRVVAHLGAAGPVIVTTAAAWFMLYRLRPVAVEASAHPPIDDPSPVRRPLWLLVHAVSFISLLFVTNSVFGTPVAPDGPALLWLAAWCFLAVAVSISVLLGILGGARWLRVLPRDLRVAGPVGLLAWLGGLASAAGWQQCRSLTLPPVARLLSWLSNPAEAIPDTNLLRLERFTLMVSPGCSGHEGFGIFGVLMLAYLYACRRELRFPQAWLALPFGLLVVWAANVIRFAALSSLGVHFEPSVAVASFHSKATWVLFAAIAVGTAGILRRHAMRGRA